MTEFIDLQISPREVIEVDEEHYDYALGAVPPIQNNGFWSMGEIYDHAPNGDPIFYNYKRVGDRYFGCLATPAEASAAFGSLAELSRQHSTSRQNIGPEM